MPVFYGKGAGCLSGLWQRLKSGIVQEVSEDNAWCEFDCKELQCSIGDRENCEIHQRLKSQYQQQS